jgi:hypothetical protein
VRDRVAIGVFERRPPLLPGWRREVTPPTQVVRPPFFVNENVFYPPLTQRVPTKVRTTADAKAMATANANALEHGGRLPEAAYPRLMEIDVTRRLAKAARTRPEKFRKTADPIEVDQEISRAREIKKDDPDISRRALAKEVADYFGRKPRTVEEHLKQYFKE